MSANAGGSRQRSAVDFPHRADGKHIRLDSDIPTNMSPKDYDDSSVGLDDVPFFYFDDGFSGVEGGLEDAIGHTQEESIEAPGVDSRMNDNHQVPPLDRREKFTPGAPRADPCEQCVRSALAGKSALGDDLCRDVDGSRTKRCFRCATGSHRCSSIAPEMVQLSRRLMVAVKESDKSMIKNLRVTMSTIQALIKEGTITSVPPADSGTTDDRQTVNEAGSSMEDSQKRQRLMALFGEVVDVLLTD